MDLALLLSATLQKSTLPPDPKYQLLVSLLRPRWELLARGQNVDISLALQRMAGKAYHRRRICDFESVDISTVLQTSKNPSREVRKHEMLILQFVKAFEHPRKDGELPLV